MAKRKKVDGTDRFIPRRSTQDMDIASLQVQSKGLHDKSKARSTTFHQALAQTMFGVSDMSALPVYNLTASNERRTNTTRCRPNALLNHIVAPVSAIRIMDAPNVENDFYLNLMDWGSNDVLAIALGKSIYLWNRQTKSHSKLFTLRSQTITSLKWGANTHINNLAVGTSNGNVEFWDTRAKRCCGKFTGHAARVSSLAWKGHILTTGSLDNTIAHYDTRMESSRLSTLRQHKGEVCGLAWSLDGRMLASGGSDHTICVWSNDLARRDPWHSINSHKAAVKAVSWSPWDNGILATGGGAIDKTVKRWRITERTCKLQHSHDTEAQISGLLWSRPGVHSAKQLLSSHGPNVNSLKLWDVGGMTLLKVYGGHTGRILTMTESPDGSTVATLGADETLHFWPGFDLTKRRKRTREDISSLDKIAGLR